MIVETRKPIPAKPGQPVRYDYEYERNGVANIFMTFAPLEGWRKVKVTDHHAAVDYAQVLKELSDVYFPDAKQIVLVQDNLNTHTAASLYAAFPAEEARRLAKRFEWHYTPKHGSWLDANAVRDIFPEACARAGLPYHNGSDYSQTSFQFWRGKNLHRTPMLIHVDKPKIAWQIHAERRLPIAK